MSKAKAPPKDYNADLRIRPLPDEHTTEEELTERFDRVVKGVVSGGAPRRAAQKPEEKTEPENSAWSETA